MSHFSTVSECSGGARSHGTKGHARLPNDQNNFSHCTEPQEVQAGPPELPKIGQEKEILTPSFESCNKHFWPHLGNSSSPGKGMDL